MLPERIRELRSDERGVSPVLGVALLIAITVTLVAVIGVVVLGIGPTNTGAPQANLVFQYNSTSAEVTMAHQGGDKLDSSTLEIQVEGTATADTLPAEMTAGDTTTVATGAADDDTVKIVWQAASSDDSQVIASFEVG